MHSYNFKICGTQQMLRHPFIKKSFKVEELLLNSSMETGVNKEERNLVLSGLCLG